MSVTNQIEKKSQLQTLLKDIVSVDPRWEREISGLSTDSRTVKKGNLFIAYVGGKYDGRQFIDDALARGVAAVICEANETPAIQEREINGHIIPIFAVKQLPKYIGSIAARFYGEPAKQLTIIGITGTNGKTSCSQFIARSLQTAGHLCGVIGTLGAGFPDHLQNSNALTTPDPITLQHLLADFHQQGAEAVAMEVSSHSLVQDRVQGVPFAIAVFTNLTRDHLDYHGTMENYAKAKKLLFEKPGLNYAVINLDDHYGREFLTQLPKDLKIYGYTIANSAANIPTISASDIKMTGKGFSAKINSPWGEGSLNSQLLGRFNLSNLLAVLTTLNLLKIPFAKTLAYVNKLKTVPGRMQVFGGGKQPTVVVDYSHTPDALEKALTALREHCQGKLWCVFGCGGDRDRGKRPLMAQIAERFSDHVIITDDNPRQEDSRQIVDDIVKGLLCPWAAEIIQDRATAIAHAIQSAQLGDVVLIAGKGHEDYQIIGTEKLPFSDSEQVQAQLKLRN